LRSLFDARLGLDEPGEPALFDPLPLPRHEPAARTAPLRVVAKTHGPHENEIARYADPPREPTSGGSLHTAVHEDTLDPGALELADVILRQAAADDPRFGGPDTWAAEVLTRHAGCALAAYVTGPGTCVVHTRSGHEFLITGRTTGPDPAAYASALHVLLAAGTRPAALAESGLTVVTGGTAHHAAVAVSPRPAAPGR
jgi:hypothetical protein